MVLDVHGNRYVVGRKGLCTYFFFLKGQPGPPIWPRKSIRGTKVEYGAHYGVTILPSIRTPACGIMEQFPGRFLGIIGQIPNRFQVPTGTCCDLRLFLY